MDIRLTDAELRIMNVLWQEGDTTAKHIFDTLKGETGWSINTTYTLIKRCITKGAIQRTEPHFQCHALVAKHQVQEVETADLIGKLYDGSADKLFAALLDSRKISREQLRRLKDLVEELE